MLDEIKFSVVVAVYNVESYIDQCLHSIVNQTYPNLDIILVNDGSTDESLKKLLFWEQKDSRVKVVSKTNGGLSSARNYGMKYISGQYVCFVDGDDWLDLKLFERLHQFICEKGAVDIVCYAYSMYYSEKRQCIKSFGVDDVVYSGPVFFEKSDFQVQAWNRIYSRDFLKRMGLLFLEGRLHEDISFTVPLCLSAQSVAAIGDVGYYYRQNRSGSIMAAVKERNVLDFANALVFGYCFLKERGLLTEYYQHWLSNKFFYACFTHKTSYRILRRCLENVGAPMIVKSIADDLGDAESARRSRLFFLKLFFCHAQTKIRFLIGQIIHYRRYH